VTLEDAHKLFDRVREMEDQELEDESFRKIPQHTYECKHLGVCMDRPSHCLDCPSNNA